MTATVGTPIRRRGRPDLAPVVDARRELPCLLLGVHIELVPGDDDPVIHRCIPDERNRLPELLACSSVPKPLTRSAVGRYARCRDTPWASSPRRYQRTRQGDCDSRNASVRDLPSDLLARPSGRLKRGNDAHVPPIERALCSTIRSYRALPVPSGGTPPRVSDLAIVKGREILLSWDSLG